MSLQEWMRQNGEDDISLAAMVPGVTPDAVKKWRLGLRCPRTRYQRRILALTGGQVSPMELQRRKKKEAA